MSEDRRDPGLTDQEYSRSNAHGYQGSRTDYYDAEEEISILDLLVVAAENLRLLIFGPLLAGLIALGYAYTITPTFTARTSFLPPEKQQSVATAALAQLGPLAGAAALASGLKNPADQFVSLLKSVTVADSLIDRFKLMELYETAFRQNARKALGGNTKISAGKDGLIVVVVDDISPQRAADIANAYVSELQSLMGRLALTEAQKRRVFFEDQLERTKTRLTAAEQALGAIGISASAINAEPEAAVAAVARLQAQVTAQEVRLAAMRSYLTESAPQFQQAQIELRALRAQLGKSAAGNPTATSAGGYIEKYRDFKYQETLFKLFVQQFELAKIDEAREGAVIQVVDVAFPPEHKSKPSKAKIAVLTTLATGLLLLMWVFVRNAIDNSAAHPEGAGKLAAIRGGVLRLFMLNKKRT
jgi:uncharacterized protein involved in exopolysaccharide biosynthesis